VKRRPGPPAGCGTTDGTEVHLWHWLDWSNPYWCVGQVYAKSTGIVYQMRNTFSGKCLTATGTGSGLLVQQYTCNLANDGQLWEKRTRPSVKINGTSYETYIFINPLADKCLDVRDMRSDDGAIAQIWGCSGGLNQRWY
jgi:hypothetical protein